MLYVFFSPATAVSTITRKYSHESCVRDSRYLNFWRPFEYLQLCNPISMLQAQMIHCSWKFASRDSKCAWSSECTDLIAAGNDTVSWTFTLCIFHVRLHSVRIYHLDSPANLFSAYGGTWIFLFLKLSIQFGLKIVRTLMLFAICNKFWTYYLCNYIMEAFLCVTPTIPSD